MSRFIEKLKKQLENPPLPIGFRREPRPEITHSILLIARVAIDAAGTPINNIEGADAVLLFDENSKVTAKTLPMIVKPLKDTPWGVILDESEDTAQTLAEAGCDFVVLSPTCPITAVPEAEKVGKILEVESAMDDGLLRAVNSLPVDAVLASDTFGESDKLIWHHLMILRNLALLVIKPLIVPVSATIDKVELKALWDAGIEAVMVSVDVTKGENLKELRDIAAKLPPRTARKPGKVDVLIPRAAERTAPSPPDEEEEDG